MAEKAPVEGGSESERPTIDESLVRGEMKLFGGAVVEVEDTYTGAASVKIRDSEDLVYARVDLTREDAERVRDELAAVLAE